MRFKTISFVFEIMDHGASLMSFLVVILVAYASFLPPFTAEARTKLVHQDNTHPHAKGHHHVDSPPRPTPKTPPPPPSPPIIHDDYFPPPPPPLHPPPPIHPPALIVSPAPVPSLSAPPPSSSPSPSPSLSPQSDYNSPPPFVLGVTPIGYWPPNGSWKCGQGPCWGSEFCDYPCNYCGANSTCIVEEDYYFPDP